MALGVVTLAAGTFLSVGDLIGLYVGGTLSWDAAIEAAAFDYLGAAFLGSIIVVIRAASASIATSLEPSSAKHAFVSGCSAILMCGGASVFAYYLGDFFFRPLPVQMDLRLTPGARGSIATDKATKEEDAFKVIPRGVDPNNVRWDSPDGNLLADWSASSDKAHFDLSVDLFSGCMVPSALGEKKPTNSFRLQDVKRVSVSFAQGAKSLAIYGSGRTGELTVDRGNVAQYGIDRDDATKKNSVWEFVDEASLEYSSRDDVAFYLGTYTIDMADEDTAEIQPVSLHVEADGKPYEIVIDAPAGMSDTLISCKGVSAARAFRRGSAKLPKASATVGARVTLKSRPVPFIFRTATSSLKITGTSGWVAASELDDDVLEKSSGGKIWFTAAKGDAGLEVNGTADGSSKSTDEYYAFGDLHGEYEKEGRLHISGTAEVLQKNGIRRNPTKFEGGLSGQLALIGGVLVTALSTLVVTFRKLIATNAAFDP
ncbi:hypothetical protein U8P71_14965 [Rhizobium ruizarguesonis]|nr:hypothetical protein U8P71_14965 [Rhizobium ruizarguesonis]